jgi:hypothetical protein
MQRTDRIHLGIGAVAVPCAIAGVAMIDMQPLMAKVLFGVAGVAFVWGAWPFIFRRRRKRTKSHATTQRIQLPKTDYTKLDSVSQEEKDLIGHIGFRMMDTHGHLDLHGMLSDCANGVEINDLMFKPCHICGVIRNKRSRGK